VQEVRQQCVVMVEIEIRLVKLLAASVQALLSAGSPETLSHQANSPTLNLIDEQSSHAVASATSPHANTPAC
jgi:hypothetical protein